MWQHTKGPSCCLAPQQPPMEISQHPSFSMAACPDQLPEDERQQFLILRMESAASGAAQAIATCQCKRDFGCSVWCQTPAYRYAPPPMHRLCCVACSQASQHWPLLKQAWRRLHKTPVHECVTDKRLNMMCALQPGQPALAAPQAARARRRCSEKRRASGAPASRKFAGSFPGPRRPIPPLQPPSWTAPSR